MQTRYQSHAGRHEGRLFSHAAWRYPLSTVAVLGILLMTVALIPTSASAASCSSLASLSLPDTTISTSQSAPTESSQLPPWVQTPTGIVREDFKNLPEFCRVEAQLRPTKDSNIKIEVWMPVSGWNGKLIAIGNGGWSGEFIYSAMAQFLRRGYAVASTDTGHTGNSFDATFALGHPEKLIDFGYRSVHLMTVRAKAIIAAFYGNGPRLSYWDGCSSGGHQGLTEAQRYPDDYNGIVEGDPASYWTHLMFALVWPGEFILKSPAGGIPQDKLQLIHKAVLDACDKLDGIADGIINDPTKCHFDVKSLECKGEDTAGCLAPTQVETAIELYAGPKNPRTGEQIFPGVEPGSELAWSNLALPDGPGPFPIGVNYFKYVLFGNTNWDYRTLNFDRDVELADRQDAHILNATDPNLKAFKAHGGKLIMYHGWSDAIIAPGESVNYYDQIVEVMGGRAKTMEFARLFMVPAMGHCGGGLGVFDKVGPLEQWVEHGVAPDSIIGSHLANGVVDMTRPLCPYPQVARWKGTGSTNDAANFACVNPVEK